MKMAVSPPRRA